MMLGVRLLIVAVVLFRLAEELCKGCNIHGLGSPQLPLAAGKPLLDLLQQPTVTIGVLERVERKIRTTLRVAPADARILHGIDEGAAGVVEGLAHLDVAGDQLATSGLDVD